MRNPDRKITKAFYFKLYSLRSETNFKIPFFFINIRNKITFYSIKTKIVKRFLLHKRSVLKNIEKGKRNYFLFSSVIVIFR